MIRPKHLSLALAGLVSCSIGLGQIEESSNTVRLATSTSVSDSGLMDLLIPLFEAETDYVIQLSPVGTGTALRLGRAGKVDVIIVHAPKAELKFLEGDYGDDYHPVMHNDFIIAGPPSDPANIRGSKDVTKAFRRIMESKSAFISRADDSGTNKKELEIWKRCGITPIGANWYIELGQSIGATLSYSSENAAYTLADRGTWLALRKKLDLELLFEGDPLLFNPYGVISVNSEKHSHVNGAGAKAFNIWITSRKIQKVIGSFHVDGEKLFTPASHTDH